MISLKSLCHWSFIGGWLAQRSCGHSLCLLTAVVCLPSAVKSAHRASEHAPSHASFPNSALQLACSLWKSPDPGLSVSLPTPTE